MAQLQQHQRQLFSMCLEQCALLPAEHAFCGLQDAAMCVEPYNWRAGVHKRSGGEQQ
jgi:hypothetical protein